MKAYERKVFQKAPSVLLNRSLAAAYKNLSEKKFANPTEEFYLKGYVRQKLNIQAEYYPKVMSFLENVRQAGLGKAKLSDGLVLEEKMKSYFILRNTQQAQMDPFLDFLFANNIPDLLFQLVNSHLYLASISIIVHKPGIVANTEWHRDTHYLTGKLMGPMPPGVKIYFYPRFDRPSFRRVEFLPFSHRIDLQDEKLDWVMARKFKTEVISSSNEDYSLFDTTALHRALPDQDAEGSVRVLFNFYRQKEQLARYDWGDFIQKSYAKRMGMAL